MLFLHSFGVNNVLGLFTLRKDEHEKMGSGTWNVKISLSGDKKQNQALFQCERTFALETFGFGYFQ